MSAITGVVVVIFILVLLLIAGMIYLFVVGSHEKTDVTNLQQLIGVTNGTTVINRPPTSTGPPINILAYTSYVNGPMAKTFFSTADPGTIMLAGSDKSNPTQFYILWKGSDGKSYSSAITGNPY